MAGTFNASSSQYMTLGSSLSFPRNLSQLTMTCWVTPGTLINTETFVIYFARNGSTNSGWASFSVRTSTAKWRLNGRITSSASIYSCDSNSSVVAGTKYFLAGVHNYTSGYMYLYINGILDNSLTGISGWNTTSQDADAGGARLGSRPDGSSTTFQHMSLSDVRLYQRELSADEIYNMFVAKGRDTITESLYERWEFMDGADGSAISTTQSIGSNQGVATSGSGSAAPSYSENLCGTRSRI